MIFFSQIFVLLLVLFITMMLESNNLAFYFILIDMYLNMVKYIKDL